jgi:hypothetical protein
MRPFTSKDKPIFNEVSVENWNTSVKDPKLRDQKVIAQIRTIKSSYSLKSLSRGTKDSNGAFGAPVRHGIILH